jgi:hypothetical protein
MTDLATISTEVPYKLSPEHLTFAQTYLSSLSLSETAKTLQITEADASELYNNREVKKFIDTVFLQQGYLNRFKLVGLLNKIIDSKLTEAEETGIYSNKDLLDVVQTLHKINMDHEKLNAEKSPSKQTNVQVNNYGENLSSLLDRLVRGE